MQLTEGERTLVEYSHVLSHWLWPSDKARPDPGEVPYPKYKPEEYGSSSTNNTVLNGSSAGSIFANFCGGAFLIVFTNARTEGDSRGRHRKIRRCVPLWSGIAIILKMLLLCDPLDLARRLKNAVDGRCLSWEILHLASLMQEVSDSCPLHYFNVATYLYYL